MPISINLKIYYLFIFKCLLNLRVSLIQIIIDIYYKESHRLLIILEETLFILIQIFLNYSNLFQNMYSSFKL